MSDQSATVRAATSDDIAAISALHERVFGPGRFARTAYRVREGGASLVSPFCLVSFRGDQLIAAIRFTEVTIGGVAAALLLGPLAVEPELAGQGFGKELVARGLDAARQAGQRLVVLVGDEPYYARFGFKPVPPGQLFFPGPVDPARILAAELEPGALVSYSGLVAARA